MEHSQFSHPHPDAVSPCLRSLGWFAVFVRAAFPVALASISVKAGAVEHRFLQQSAQPTQVYTLCAGETATSVAKKFHLTLERLSEINQLRTFARGLNGLRPGDDVDVPLMMAKNTKSAKGGTSSDWSTTVEEVDWQGQELAAYTSQAGRLLAGRAKSDTAASMARGMTTGEIGVSLHPYPGCPASTCTATGWLHLAGRAYAGIPLPAVMELGKAAVLGREHRQRHPGSGGLAPAPSCSS